MLTAVLESATRQRVLFEAKLSGPLQRQQRQSTVHLESSALPPPSPPPPSGLADSEPPDSAGATAPPPSTRRRSSKRITFAEPAEAVSPPGGGDGDRDADEAAGASAWPAALQPPDILRIEPPKEGEGLAESDEELLAAAVAAAVDSEAEAEEEAERSISVISSSVSLAGIIPASVCFRSVCSAPNTIFPILCLLSVKERSASTLTTSTFLNQQMTRRKEY